MSWRDQLDKRVQNPASVQKLSNERLLELINELEDYETEWNKWESNFITNLSERLMQELFITDDQCNKLEEVHAKYLK